jgi:hypothetical protein
VIQPVTKVTSPTAPAAAPAGVVTAFDAPPAAIAAARGKAAQVRNSLSQAVRATDAAVKAILSLDDLVSDPKAAQALSLEGLDPDTLKRFTKAAQPLLAYLQAPATP